MFCKILSASQLNSITKVKYAAARTKKNKKDGRHMPNTDVAEVHCVPFQRVHVVLEVIFYALVCKCKSASCVPHFHISDENQHGPCAFGD